jgi:hypothetical protein
MSGRALGPRGASAAAALVGLCVLVARGSPSLANGRFPSAGQLIVDPTNGAHIVVRTTFGLLQTFDAGATWTWLCEGAVSPDGFQDPEVIFTSGGRIGIGLPDGLAIGERDGCTWTRAAGLTGDDVIDLVVSGSDPATAYAAAVVRVNGAFNGSIARTSNGVTWSAVGALLPDTYPLTIEIAASRPQRLYLGANDGNLETGLIDVSDDAGVTWRVHDSPGGVDAVYVSAVDPDDADRVYVRSYSPQSNLYVSEDGARTWTTIFESAVPLLGFALSPDGRQIALGGAGGLAILARTERADGGSDASTQVDGDGGGGGLYTVVATNPLPVSCLAWTAGGLFACADEISAGFTIGVSRDDGRTFAPMLHLAELTPVACAAGTSGALCAGEWCATATVIGASCTVDAATDTARDGGGPTATSASGCACDVASHETSRGSPRPALAVVALLVGCALLGRRAGIRQ